MLASHRHDHVIHEAPSSPKSVSDGILESAMTSSTAYSGQVLHDSFKCEATPLSVLVSFAEKRDLFALESVCNTNGYGKYSIFGFGAIDSLECNLSSSSDSAMTAMHELAARINSQPTAFAEDVPFCGGWVGYIPYELGALLERVYQEEWSGGGSPSMRFSLYDTVAVFNHLSGNWTVCGVELAQSGSPADKRVRELAEEIRSVSQPDGSRPFFLATDNVCKMPKANMTKQEYLAKARRAIDYIAAGDIYQVNLTQRFSTRTDAPPLDLYFNLRETNSASYSAYLSWPDRSIISSSPELFLQTSTTGRVITRPIKGTIGRCGDAECDRFAQLALQASGKDQAELNMIIDLLRNDLGRVCEFGSVRVEAAHELEEHPTVYHLVSTITGQLRRSVQPVDLLLATFPGGSITGCPKIRAMQIINELEPTKRDVYCGAIGYISLDRRLAFNIAIRTMLYDRGDLHVYAGGAITADSDPGAEYREVLAKAEGMFRALGHTTSVLGN